MKSFNPNIYSSDKMAHRDRLLTENIEKGPINPSFDISVLKNNDPGPDAGKTPAFASIWATIMSRATSSRFINQVHDGKGNLYVTASKFGNYGPGSPEYTGLFDAELDPGNITNPTSAGILGIQVSSGLIRTIIFIIKYSPDGEVLWATYNNRDYTHISDIYVTLLVDGEDNLYMITDNYIGNSYYFNASGKTNGNVNAPTPAGSQTTPTGISIAKYNTNGQVQWVQTSNGSNQYSVSMNSLDELVVLVRNGDYCNVNTLVSTSPGTVGVQSQYASLSAYSLQIYIYNIHSNGTCKWATMMSNVSESMLWADIAIDDNNVINVYVTVYGFTDYILFYNALSSDPSNPTPSGEITVAGTTINPIEAGTLLIASLNNNGAIRFATIVAGIQIPLGETEIVPRSISCDNDNIYIGFRIRSCSNLLFFNATPLSAGSVVNPISSGNIPILTGETYTIFLRYDSNGIIKSFTYIMGITVPFYRSYLWEFRAQMDKLNNSNLYTTLYRQRTISNPVNFFSSAPLIGINVQPPIPAGSIPPNTIDYSIMIKFNSELVIQWASLVHELSNINKCIPSGVIFDSIGNPCFYGVDIAGNANSNLGFYSPNSQGEVSLSQTLSLSFPNPNNYSSAWIAKYNDADGRLINGISTHFFPNLAYYSSLRDIGLTKATIYEDEIYLSFISVANPTRYFNHYDGTSVVDPIENFAGSITLDTEGQNFLVVNKYGNTFALTPDYLIKPTYEINSPIRERVKYIYNDLGYKVLIKTNGYIDNENTKPDLLFGEPGGAITLIPNNGKWTVSSELGFTFL